MRRVRACPGWAWPSAWLLLLAGLGVARPASAQLTNYTRLHSFGLAERAGDSPQAAVTPGSDGLFYGVTTDAAGGGRGSAFRVKQDGSGYVVLHRFGISSDDGTDPYAPLVEAGDGMLYGTTFRGGRHGYGTVFRLARDGSSYAALHHFGLYLSDGLGVLSGVSEGTDGALYGSTVTGPASPGGTLFKVSKQGEFVVLRTFSTETSLGEHTPNAVLAGRDGMIYGTTFSRNATNRGVLFKLGQDGTGYTILHEFGLTPGDGQTPLAGLIEGSDGALYGTTFQGGSLVWGVVFRIQRDGGGYTLLHDFADYAIDGGGLKGRLCEGSDGFLYGVSGIGGAFGFGTLFRLRKDGSDFSVVRDLGQTAEEGWQSSDVVYGNGGALFGTTPSGGRVGAGTLFRIDPNPSRYTRLVDFQPSGGDAQSPAAPLVEAGDSRLYGVTRHGGTNAAGALFRVGRDGAGYSVVRHFGVGTGDAREPAALLSDGGEMLYGATRGGGAFGRGTVFRMNRNGGALVVMRDFGGTLAEGAEPVALFQGGDGLLYGATLSGAGSGGCVFRLQTNGLGYESLVEFSRRGDLRHPRLLFQGRDSWIYGTTTLGGDSGYGAIFRHTVSGSDYTVIYQFTDQQGAGRGPVGLLLGSDGLLYCATSLGGIFNAGTLFRIDTTGANFSIIRHFNAGNPEGGVVCGGLVEGPDGALYGTVSQPVPAIFKVNKDGTGYGVLRRFEGNEREDVPEAPLLYARDGAFYGTAGSGGDVGLGTLFRFGHRLGLSKQPSVARIECVGLPNLPYRLQRTQNFSNWTTLRMFELAPDEVFAYDDLEAPADAGFYRLLAP